MSLNLDFNEEQQMLRDMVRNLFEDHASLTSLRELEDDPTGYSLDLWRQLAELCGRYLTKGRKVAVTGSIQTRTYEAQDGSKRSAFDIVADEVEFLSANQSSGAPSGDYHQAPAAPAAPRAQAPAYAPADAGFTQVDDDELPF